MCVKRESLQRSQCNRFHLRFPKNNEALSAADAKKCFTGSLKCDDEMDKKIEEAIENIQRGTCKKAGGRKREKRKGREGKRSRVSEMKVRRHCRRKLKLL